MITYDSIINVNSQSIGKEKKKLHKKLKFWEKYRVNIPYLFFFATLSFCFGIHSLGFSEFIAFGSSILLSYVFTVEIPIRIENHRLEKLNELKRLELQHEIVDIMDKKMEWGDMHIVDKVVAPCVQFNPPSCDVVSKMTELLLRTGHDRLYPKGKIKTIQEDPLKEQKMGILYERIMGLNVRDLKILKTWIKEYIKEEPELDKITKLTQFIVETKILGCDLEDTKKHIECVNQHGKHK